MLSETRAEEINQDTKPETDFTILATKLKEINLTNMPISTKHYIAQKMTSLQNKGNHLQQQQLQT